MSKRQKTTVLIFALGLSDIAGGKLGGNFYHVLRLVGKLVELEDYSVTVLADERVASYFEALQPTPKVVLGLFGVRGGVIGNELSACYWAHRLMPAIFHRPAGQLPILPLCGRLICGIADINFRDLHWTGFRRLYKEAGYQFSFLRDSVTVAVSEATAARVRAEFGLRGGKLVCIHHGAEGCGGLTPSNEAQVERGYWLVFGHRPNKNLELALAAFERTSDSLPGLRLVVIGENAYSRRLVEQSSSRHSIQILSYVSDASLEWLYRNSVALLFPSSYEGFGLPILEAMRFGCPVLASDIAPHREVIGDAVPLLPLDCIADWAAAMAVLAADDSARQQAIRAGFHRARLFTWAEASRKTATIYRRILATNQGMVT
jgi:glycosyltransferase involved in cell wall biosynthesis